MPPVPAGHLQWHRVLRLAELLVELCGVLAGVRPLDQVEAHVLEAIAATEAALAAFWNWLIVPAFSACPS